MTRPCVFRISSLRLAELLIQVARQFLQGLNHNAQGVPASEIIKIGCSIPGIPNNLCKRPRAPSLPLDSGVPLSHASIATSNAPSINPKSRTSVTPSIETVVIRLATAKTRHKRKCSSPPRFQWRFRDAPQRTGHAGRDLEQAGANGNDG